MNTVILNGSPRKNGDTAFLINMIVPKIKGNVKIINTFFENVLPCCDCRKCYTLDRCAISDSMEKFFCDIYSADNVILASPLHYSMLSGSLLSFVSRFQYFFVSEKIRKDKNVVLKKKKGYLILTGGGATKDFYPVEKVSKLIFRQINASIDGIFKYIDTDRSPLSEYESFDEGEKRRITHEAYEFTKIINGDEDI